MPEASPIPAHLTGLLDCCAGQVPEAVLRDFIMFSPTPHVVQTHSGVRIYTRCALDTLLAAWVLGGDIDIETTPPGQTQPLRLMVRNGQLDAPLGAVLALPTPANLHTAQELYQSFCPYALVFPDDATYHAWSVTTPVLTTPVTLQDAFELARQLVERLTDLHTLHGEGGARCC